MFRNIFYLICWFILMPPLTIFAAHQPEDNGKCLHCHGSSDIRSKTGSYNLYVDPLKFTSTTHALIGCASCHDNVTANHPKNSKRPARAVCQKCHGPVQEEYGKSLHAEKAQCADCHNPHEVKNNAAVSGREINFQCERCHDNARTVASHSKWLPQASLHIDSLPCITCHTGSRNYFITLYIEKRIGDNKFSDFKLAENRDLARISQNRNIHTLMDKNNDNLVTIAELSDFSKWAKNNNMRLKGMMMPENMTHSFQILDNRWDCTFCHASGPKAMQTSFVAFPEQNGTFTRLAVEKGAILDALYGTPDFYMMGATRSSSMNIVGALIVAGGLMMPVGHGTLRLFTRKKRKEH